MKKIFMFGLLSMFLFIIFDQFNDQRPDQIAKLQVDNKEQLKTLGMMINSEKLTNTIVLKHYAMTLSKSNPQLKPLLDQLALDATTKGPLYQGLVARNEAAQAPSQDLDKQLSELRNINVATSPAMFNDLLSDPINTIADLSQGKLQRVKAISREAEKELNNASTTDVGNQLVGNPAYGSWETDPQTGMSFWAWYGVYSMFSNILQPIRYDSWAANRNYSYYNDVGRYRYSSPKQITNQDSLQNRTKKAYVSKGKTFKSPYATRTGATGLSQQSKSSPKTSSTFRSNYAKDSSFRNSSSRTSRGVSRGK